MEQQIQTLTSLSQVLHLTHHRNKNQHRLSKWYKSFSQLRRQILKLISELEVLDRALKYDEGKGEGKYVKAAREKVERRVRFWREREVGRWFLAFSNLVADNQYAPLGLMLIAILAQVKSVMKSLSGEVDIEEQEVLPETEIEKLMSGLVSQPGLDLGEVVGRDEIRDAAGKEEEEEDEEIEVRLKSSSKKMKLKRSREEEVEGEEVDITPKPSSKKTKLKRPRAEDTGPTTTDSKAVKKPKKKKKKGDAFDDLFASLL